MELDNFHNIQIVPCTDKERRKLIDDSISLFSRVRRKIFHNTSIIINETVPYNVNLFKINQGYLIGYWGCGKYYEDIMEILFSEFEFPKFYDAKNIKTEQKIMNDSESVSVHIRRGDYLEGKNIDLFGG